MILPLFYHTSTLFSGKSVYNIFSELNELDMSDSRWNRNTKNLVAFVNQTDPLVIHFTNQRYLLGGLARHASTSITATLTDELNSTNITLRVNTNWVYAVIYGLFTIGLVKEILVGQLDAKLMPLVVITIVFAGIDMLSKALLLAKVRSLFR